MRRAIAGVAGLVFCATLAILAAGCTSERLALDLVVTANPNPATGVDEPGGRRWDYSVSITNPTAAGVTVKYYHAAIGGTDTGYTQQLQAVRDSAIIGLRIEPGATLAYPANRSSDNRFARGRERRIFHAQADDGTYHSGEVVIQLQ